MSSKSKTKSKSKSKSDRLSPIAEDRYQSRSMPSIRAIYDDLRHASKYHGVSDYSRIVPTSNKRNTKARPIQISTKASNRRIIPESTPPPSFIGRIASRVGSILPKPRKVVAPHAHPISTESWNIIRTMKYPEITTTKKSVEGGKKKTSKKR